MLVFLSQLSNIKYMLEYGCWTLRSILGKGLLYFTMFDVFAYIMFFYNAWQLLYFILLYLTVVLLFSLYLIIFYDALLYFNIFDIENIYYYLIMVFIDFIC